MSRAKPYLGQAEQIQDVSLYVGDFERGALNLPEFGYPVQIIQLHSCLGLNQKRNKSEHGAHGMLFYTSNKLHTEDREIQQNNVYL